MVRCKKRFEVKNKSSTDGEVLERVYNRDGLTPQSLAHFLPNWNYDGSSTGQARGIK